MEYSIKKPLLETVNLIIRNSKKEDPTDLWGIFEGNMSEFGDNWFIT